MKHTFLRGVTVATVLPFDASGAIDWPSYERLLGYCAVPDSVAAVFVNGHAGQATSLTGEERSLVIRRTREIIGRHKPLLAGVIAHEVADAIEQAQAAQTAGADCYVLFPPAASGGDAGAAPDAAVPFFENVTCAVDIPASVFQYPITSGLGYPTETLAAIASLSRVVAVKEGSNCILAYEENYRALKRTAPDVAFLPSNYDWFLPQLAIGADGLLSGLASLTPELLSSLWRAADSADLIGMRAASDRLHPIVRGVYGVSPITDMHTRIKVGLKALGIIENAFPRPPLLEVPPTIRTLIYNIVASTDVR